MHSPFTVPDWVSKHLMAYNSLSDVSDAEIARIAAGLEQFKVRQPVVSIVIPAYNEERELLKTLSSLAGLQPQNPTELIVANNNSTDRTQELLDRCGVKSVFAEKQGISYARQAGLEAARGTFILSADADSIYPSDWGNAYVARLRDPAVSCVYGRYSFLPSKGNTRFALSLHEMAAEGMFNLRKGQQESINVMGFNFAYRREDGLKIKGFKHNLQRKITLRSEDGWIAYELYGLGKICLVVTPNRVWTSDRRLMEDGSLSGAFINRAKRYLKTYWTVMRRNAKTYKKQEHGI